MSVPPGKLPPAGPPQAPTPPAMVIPDPETELGNLSPPTQTNPPAPKPRMTRPRKDKMKIVHADIANRVTDFFQNDDMARTDDIDARLQRYAKYRMWTEGKDWPWENSSDCAMPDMMTHSLKVQDTLHNAVMSTRPFINSKALQKSNKDKQDTIDDLLDYQLFVENKGETLIGEAADAFVNDGYYCIFTPWVHEEREVHEIMTWPPLPEGMTPEVYLQGRLLAAYPKLHSKMVDKDGWSWEVMEEDGKTWFDVEFFTVNSMIEMDAQRTTTVFEGPRPIVKDYEDILAPVRCSNLQIPSPSNPGGAAHVLMVDYPTIDEIKRLVRSGFYDLVDIKDLDELEGLAQNNTIGQQEKLQKDVFQGGQDNLTKNDGSGAGKSPDHKTLTRLTCFDIYDIDGDGVNEDVIWWVIKEKKILLRARELTQVYPANPPRRPFAEASFIPIRGRRCGISMLEMLEGLHDMKKQFLDQTIDGGTLKNVPFFFYRASSNMRPETIRLWPGEGYPLSDPKNDVSFPSFPQDGSAFGMNLMAMLDQQQEKLTNIGDLQLGRIPAGKSSALRTARGMQSVMGQGDARPEHLMRRFMMGLAEMGAQMHELNQTLLPRDKMIRICGVKKQNEDPYRKIADPAQIYGRFQFDFNANAMNTSKEALQDSLSQVMEKLFTPISIQQGIVKPDDIYQLMRDWVKSMGQDADKYLTPPTPQSTLPKMFAEEVINLILQGNLPECRPAEANGMDHMKKLMEFAGQDEFGFLTPPQVQIFKGYLSLLRQVLQQQQTQQVQMGAAADFQSQKPANGLPGPEPSSPPDMSQAPLQNNELMDESLPGAGGGGNTMQ